MSATTFPRPRAAEFAEYYGLYINRVPDGDILQHLHEQKHAIAECLGQVTADQAGVPHPPRTWTIKQVLGHMIDVEKIFGYRAHRFAVNDLRPILGMDQNVYVDGLNYHDVTLPELTEELLLHRRANLAFLRRIPDKAWNYVGVADGNSLSVRAIAYCLVGHVTHHLEIIKERVA